MMALLNKLEKFVPLFNSEEQVSGWLANGLSVVGKAAFFAKLPDRADVSNHLSLITAVLHNAEVPLTKA